MLKNTTSFGSRELLSLQRTMQLVTKLHQEARSKGVSLSAAEDQELIMGLQALHRVIYDEQV